MDDTKAPSLPFFYRAGRMKFLLGLLGQLALLILGVPRLTGYYDAGFITNLIVLGIVASLVGLISGLVIFKVYDKGIHFGIAYKLGQAFIDWSNIEEIKIVSKQKPHLPDMQLVQLPHDLGGGMRVALDADNGEFPEVIGIFLKDTKPFYKSMWFNQRKMASGLEKDYGTPAVIDQLPQSELTTYNDWLNYYLARYSGGSADEDAAELKANKWGAGVEKNKITRRDFLLYGASAMALLGAGGVAWTFIDSMNPAADIASPLMNVDISGVSAGEALQVLWEGRPVLIFHRTPAQIKAAQATLLTSLIAPQSDSERVKAGYEQYLVIMGTCACISGCAVRHNVVEGAAFFCPCCAARYDESGRIMHGPTQKNLAVPAYRFVSPTRITLGLG